MRRRDVLAGLGSAGVVLGGGAIAAYGVPSTEDSTKQKSDEKPAKPIEVETIDAPGSEAGTMLVPAPDQPTFVDIFGTWCTPCIKQMPALAEAHNRIGDKVHFISVTNESVGKNGSLTKQQLVEWWDTHGGNWTLGLDPAAELSARYLNSGYPSATAIDASGRVQWSSSGIKTADELVAGIKQALPE